MEKRNGSILGDDLLYIVSSEYTGGKVYDKLPSKENVEETITWRISDLADKNGLTNKVDIEENLNKFLHIGTVNPEVFIVAYIYRKAGKISVDELKKFLKDTDKFPGLKKHFTDKKKADYSNLAFNICLYIDILNS